MGIRVLAVITCTTLFIACGGSKSPTSPGDVTPERSIETMQIEVMKGKPESTMTVVFYGNYNRDLENQIKDPDSATHMMLRDFSCGRDDFEDFYARVSNGGGKNGTELTRFENLRICTKDDVVWFDVYVISFQDGSKYPRQNTLEHADLFPKNRGLHIVGKAVKGVFSRLLTTPTRTQGILVSP